MNIIWKNTLYCKRIIEYRRFHAIHVIVNNKTVKTLYANQVYIYIIYFLLKNKLERDFYVFLREANMCNRNLYKCRSCSHCQYHIRFFLS